MARSLKGFGSNNVGPASQTVAQHYISIGPMHRVIWCFWGRDVKASPPNAVSMTGQRRSLWVNFETALVECHVFVYSRPSDRLVLGQRRKYEQWGAALAKH